jgi:hypothetical protein
MISIAISALTNFLRKKDKDGSEIKKFSKALIPLRDLLNELYPD